MVHNHWDIGIVGLGNSLSGDDGVGLEVVKKLKTLHKNAWIHELGTDLLRIQLLVPYPKHIIFIDAVQYGGQPGKIAAALSQCVGIDIRSPPRRYRLGPFRPHVGIGPPRNEMPYGRSWVPAVSPQNGT